MNFVKPIAIIAAMAITAAGMAGIITYSNTAASSAHENIKATNEVIQTLPTIHVYPSKEQMRELRDRHARKAASDLTMPYYSYASDSAGA